ncbi:MAG: DUF1244 domain-containing protein [Lysobacter sp.]|nr:DUF1244 domain-containing protein [Lysobacter sp.]
MRRDVDRSRWIRHLRQSLRPLRPPFSLRNPAVDPQTIVELEAAAFRRLRDHLMQERPDVQNIDLMILAGFCRNCLADWYREAATERGIELSKDAARETVYGIPFAAWKAKHQTEATPEQLAAFEAAQKLATEKPTTHA